MDLSSPDYLPMVKNLWGVNSLYGLVHAIGDFNLCGAWEAGKIIDELARNEQVFMPDPPPKVQWLSSFIDWSGFSNFESSKINNETLRVVYLAAQRDFHDIGLFSGSRNLAWCPICTRSDTHRAVHQSIANRYCPIHKVELKRICAFCASSLFYRIYKGLGLFICRSCGRRIDGDLVHFNVLDHGAREEQASIRDESVRSMVYLVRIPGIPPRHFSLAAPLHQNSILNDLRVAIIEWDLAEPMISDASKILRRYFLSTRYEPHVQPEEPDSIVYQDSVLSILQEVATMGMLTGHSCVRDVATVDEGDYRECPCGVGFKLWLRRVSEQGFARYYDSCGEIRARDFETSHLGLCLSLAWYANVQAGLVDQPEPFDSVAHLLDPFYYMAPYVDRGKGLDLGSIFTLDHRFQWFAVSCTHQRLRTKRRCTELLKKPVDEGQEFDSLDIALWLMS